MRGGEIMSNTTAFDRLDHERAAKYFGQIIQKKYPDYKAVVEEVSGDEVKLYILTTKALEVATCLISPPEVRHMIEINIDSYPIKHITKIKEDFPKQSMKDDDIKSKNRVVNINFISHPSLTIDLSNDLYLSEETIIDLNSLVRELKNLI
jgi:hypothetical protein